MPMTSRMASRTCVNSILSVCAGGALGIILAILITCALAGEPCGVLTLIKLAASQSTCESAVPPSTHMKPEDDVCQASGWKEPLCSRQPLSLGYQPISHPLFVGGDFSHGINTSLSSAPSCFFVITHSHPLSSLASSKGLSVVAQTFCPLLLA